MFKEFAGNLKNNSPRTGNEEVMDSNFSYVDRFSITKDKERYLKNKQGKANYIQNYIVNNKAMFEQDGVSVDNNFTELMVMGYNGNVDLKSLATTEFKDIDANGGVEFGGVKVSSDSVKLLKTMYKKDESIFNNLYKEFNMNMQDILDKNIVVGETTGFLEGLIADIPATLGSVFQRGLYDGIGAANVQRALELDDYGSVLDMEQISPAQPLATLEALSMIIPVETAAGIAAKGAGVALKSSKAIKAATVAADVGAGIAIEAGIQYGEGGAIDTAAEFGDRYKKVQEMEALTSLVLQGTFGTAAPLIKAGAGKVSNMKTEAFNRAYQEELQNMSSLASLNDSMVSRNKNENALRDTEIRNAIEAGNDLNVDANLSNMNQGKVKFTVGNKDSGSTAYTSFKRKINTDKIKTNTDKTLSDVDDTQVLLWGKKDGTYEAIDGNKAVNSNKSVSAFVLSEKDGFTKADFDKISGMNKALNEKNVDAMKKVLNTRDTKRTKDFMSRIDSLNTMQKAIKNSTDELLNLFHRGKISSETYFKAGSAPKENQIKLAQALTDGVEFKDDIKISDSFLNENFNREGYRNIKNISKSLNANKEYREALLGDFEVISGIINSSKKNNREFTKKHLLEYYLYKLYNGSEDFRSIVLGGTRNGKQPREIAGDIIEGDWRNSTNFSEFVSKQPSNDFIKEAGRVAKHAEERANASRVKSETNKVFDNIEKQIKESKDTELTKVNNEIFIGDTKYDLNEKFDGSIENRNIFGEELDPNENTMEDMIAQLEAERDFTDMITTCKLI